MIPRDLIERWLERKSAASGFYLLQEPCSIEFEYQGRQWGHPSNYAYVSFDCEPSAELRFRADVNWPASLSRAYCADLEGAILAGIVDGLLCESFSPHSGCSLTLNKILWDEVMSSEWAFHKAARSAAKELISKGQWGWVPPRRA